MDLALSAAARAAGRRPGDRQRPGRRPVRRRRPDPTADAGWRMLRGDEVGALLGQPPRATRCAAVGASSPPRSSRPRCSAGSPRPHGLGVRRDADRLQVDLPGRGPALRLRGGARLLRRPRAACATRTASRPRCWSPSSPPTLKAEGRTLLDLLDDLAREHGLHATDQLSVRVDDLSLIADAMAPAARRAADPAWRACAVDARRGPRRGRRRPAARPTGCATPRDGAPRRRPPVRHRAQAEVLPGGRRPGRRRRRRHRQADRGRRPVGDQA